MVYCRMLECAVQSRLCEVMTGSVSMWYLLVCYQPVPSDTAHSMAALSNPPLACGR